MLFRFLLILPLALSAFSIGYGQQPDPESTLVKTVTAFQKLLEQPEDDFQENAESVLDENQFDELCKSVQAVRQITKQQEAAEILLLGAGSGRLEYQIGNKVIEVSFGLSTGPSPRINRISMSEQNQNAADNTPITWENLETVLDQAAEDWFEGAVLITRNGDVALDKAWGFANREKKIRNTTDTIFAVGSAPIDFTHAGILLLKDQGKLDLDDPITKFFENVPEDRSSTTIRHLMTGGSGLPDFHHISTDKNHDHSWIDRDEAVRRIFEQELLFAPGQGRRHSHSAWGLLAAIIEIASNETYAEFSRQRLFEPAGMHDTGFFGEPIPESRVAVGYGHRNSSTPNSPPHWGETSWLVMGSGGQTSTLGDMFRWQVAMRNGTILSPESQRQYLGSGDGVHANGDMFGFEFVHSTMPGQMFMIISNTVDSRDKRQKFDRLARRLHRLVKPQAPAAPFSLGITMTIDDEQGVTIQQVNEDSGADRAGLKVGDQLVSANGTEFQDDLLDVLNPLLARGAPIEFAIIRDGEKKIITVTPLPRK